MKKSEVRELFKLINAVYINFQVNQEKLDQWASVMKDMDYDRVMAKAKEHVQKSKFPPTIAEISAFPPEENKNLDEVMKWQQEAEKVPEEVKQRFSEKLKKLLEEKII